MSKLRCFCWPIMRDLRKRMFLPTCLLCICVLHVPGVYRGQKKVSYTLGLESQTVMNHLIGLGTELGSICKSSQCS